MQQRVALGEARQPRLKANPQLPGGYIVSGLVYDVATGKVEIVVPPSRLRREAAPGQ